MVKKEKKLVAVIGVALVVLVGVLVFQFRPKNTPATAQASASPDSLSLRPQWDVVGKALRADERIGTAGQVAAIELPKRDPFKISALLRSQFGKKPRLGPRPAAGIQSVVDPEDPEVQKRRMRERLMLTVANRTEHFEKIYKLTAILDGVALISGHSGPIKVGDKLEECVVVAIDSSAVVLKGSVGGGRENTVLACKTFEMAGRRVAKVQERILHVGDKYNGGIVKEIGKDKIVLTPGVSAAESEKLEFTVRLEIK